MFMDFVEVIQTTVIFGLECMRIWIRRAERKTQLHVTIVEVGAPGDYLDTTAIVFRRRMGNDIYLGHYGSVTKFL